MSPRLRIRMPKPAVNLERSIRARKAQRVGQTTEAAGYRLLCLVCGPDAVWKTSQTRRKTDYQGTMTTPGLPDYKFFLKARADRPSRGVWWESKANTGRLSPAQRRFRDCAGAAGELYVHGDVGALVRFLVALGEVRADQVAHYYLTTPEAP